MQPLLPMPSPRPRMMVMLPCLVLALLCLLRAEAEIPVQPDFDTEKFAGTWYVVATASNCSVFLKMKDGMKSSIATISFTPEGNLAMNLAWPMLDKCQKFELLFQRSGQAGHYMAQEKREICVMKTDYSHYAIMHQLQHNEQGTSVVLQLLMREQDLSAELLQNFKELLPSVGLTQDMLTIMLKSDQCTKATR